MVARIAPGVAVLRGYRREWLRGDILGGVTVAAYLIPQVMAYAEVAGLPAIAGLWAVVPPLLVYALLGSSRVLSVGPESTTALMTALAVAPLAAGDPARFAALASVLAVIAGLICITGFVLRLGFIAGLLSRPVLVGYMAGVAVLMIVSQLGRATGMHVEGETVLAKISYGAGHLAEVHLPTLLLAASVVLALVVMRRFLPRWPGPLLVMLAAAAVVSLAGLAARGVAVVGEVPAGLPRPSLPDLTGIDWRSMVTAAAAVAVVGYSDNVLTARAFAAKRGETIDANQELLALGAANVGSGLFHGFPVSSSGSRTVLGDSMGAKTQGYSLVAFVMIIATMYLFGPILAAFPAAALGGVVVYAALRLIDVAEFRRLARFRVAELALALTTTASVVLFDVLTGIAVAVVLSVLDLLRRIADPHDAVLGYVPGLAGMHDIDDYPHVHQVPGLVVYRYDAPIFFANAENFRRRALGAIAAAEQPVHWFVLNSEANVTLDLTAIDVLEELRVELDSRGIVLALARVKQDEMDQLVASGFDVAVGRSRIYPTLPTAVQAYGRWYRRTFGDGADWLDQLPKPPASPHLS